ncbi:ribonucleoside-triphosphate reductase, adenosylcobalamin-dependent [Clostridium sartagoforme AAU1]|uniref:Adenosylcobalamin-dependent ribonucleoside-triphosphate reductase n=1 Tax=Clostridium sartagoforme AAU1 TaxID=1202534 RepID=R9BVJ4_9CLOT|nr:ribonucleoside-triphosphate reductase, adenosylcobalamin-dependent [Clostridium sartagoforme]EOR21052.1 ribonucleoside-triphosphate reductase, adenosylcobalamin-dependent [Clostridium sartagoforme AAU1]
MKVRKRDGNLVDFTKDKIVKAIEKAMEETKIGVDHNLSEQIANEVFISLSNRPEKYHEVEDIQDVVEFKLMDSERKDVAKRYIIYRSEKEKERRKNLSKEAYKMIKDDFVSKYKHNSSPMGQLGNFVYYRTYSRFLMEQGRREYWWETVRRAVEYNTSIVPTSKEEAEKLYDNVFNLRQFLSGRTFWVGNTNVSKQYPMSNFNCAFQKIDSFQAFTDLFYLLMIGSGVGVRVLREDVNKIPKLRTNYKLIHKDYIEKPKILREDSTSLVFYNNTSAEIVIGDSKEGWVQALEHFLNLVGRSQYRNINTIIIDYSHVRPKGERLRTFGGTASGHESLKNMFYKIDKVIKRKSLLLEKDNIKLSPIDCLDIANIIGENVVVGGVRRTAEMVIIDANDEECIEAKSNLYKQEDGKWSVNKDLIHRQMSNNSIYYTKKPSRERLKWNIEKMRYSGEPGWINAEAAEKRRPNMNGVNPCGEILLDSQGLCNLTTVNVFAFVKENGSLDEKALLEAQRLSARAGYRMTCVELELPDWDRVQQRDKLIGCSLTGWQDMINATSFTKEQEAELLRKLKKAAKDAALEYAKELGQNEPLLVTTIKPEGTLSQLPTVSSGVHYSHSPYFIRRVRISSDDPLVKVCEELGYPVVPEVGQSIENCTTKVVEFPVKAPEGKTKYEVSAIEQLENYKMFMENYVEHNCSITVHVRNHEWEEVEQWVWDNWDSVVAVSFLPLDDSFYELLPYEAINKEEYEKRVKEMKPFVPSLISKYEKEEVEFDIGNEGCEGGICPIR